MKEIKRISVCLDHEIFLKLRVSAAEENMSVSEYVRNIVKDKVKK